MALLKESDLRQLTTRLTGSVRLAKAAEVLAESSRSGEGETFDVFISHSFLDSQLILGLRCKLEQHGFSSYVDWADDPELERDSVTSKTASLLRERMRNCRSLLFAVTSNAPSSKWMPWECGFFDALHGRVAICPLVTETRYDFRGQEYLGLYPYVAEANDTNGRLQLWIQESPDTYVRMKQWLSGFDPQMH